MFEFRGESAQSIQVAGLLRIAWRPSPPNGCGSTPAGGLKTRGWPETRVCLESLVAAACDVHAGLTGDNA